MAQSSDSGLDRLGILIERIGFRTRLAHRYSIFMVSPIIHMPAVR